MTWLLLQLDEELSGVVEVVGMVSNNGTLMSSAYTILHEEKDIAFGKCFFKLKICHVQVALVSFFAWLCCDLIFCPFAHQIWSSTTRLWRSSMTSHNTIPLKWPQLDKCTSGLFWLCCPTVCFCKCVIMFVQVLSSWRFS